MKHLCLFSGIAGFSLGFKQAGFETVAFSEIEPFPCRVLEHRFPGVPNLGDVRGIDGEDVQDRFGPIDVISFGSPCQDWSVAGKRLGLKGHRSSLFHEAIRIIRGVGPALAVFENVPGLLSAAGGWDFAAVLDEMADVGALDIGWRILDAQYAGVPQRRRRVFVVADFRGHRTSEILSLGESVPRHSPASGEKGKAVAALSASGVGTCGADDNQGQADQKIYACQGTNVGRAGTLRSGNGNVTGGVPFTLQAPSLVSNGDSHSGFRDEHGLVAFSSQDDGGDATLGTDPTLRVGTGLDIPSAPAVAISENQRAEIRTSEVHPQLSSGGGKPGQGYPAVAFALRGREDGTQLEVSGNQTSSVRGSSGGSSRDYVATPLAFQSNSKDGARIDGDTACTLSAGDYSSSTSNNPRVMSGMAVRRLTPTECERLQGFPDLWTDVPGASDSARYRALGNAVCVNVTAWIARRLAGVMKETKEEVA